MLVSASIGVILAGIATFAFTEALNLFNRSIRQSQAEADMIGAMYMLKSTYAQSTLVKYGGDVVTGGSGTNAATNRLETITSDESTYGIHSFGYLYRHPGYPTITSGIHLVSYSNKDLANDSDDSSIFATGVYYQTYSNTAGSYKSGALFFDLERFNGGWVTLSPVNAVSAFGRFTDFAVENIRVLDTDGTILEDVTGSTHLGKPVLSAEFKLAMRYFTKGSVRDWRWCPSSIVSTTAACKTDVNYYDIQKRVKVVFVNNTFGASPYSSRPYGNLYMFKTLGPSFRRSEAN